MKELKRIVRITLYVMGIFLILASCAEKKTYGVDEPDSPTANKKVDICRIGNDVIRLSVIDSSSWGDGELYLSTTTDFSSTPYLETQRNYSWSSLSTEEQEMYPFYLKPEVDKKYYYYVSCYSEKIASGSFIMKDITDILKVKKMTSTNDGIELVLSVPVWFLNIVDETYLYVFRKGENSSNSSNITSTYGSLDKVNHEIKYNLNEYSFKMLEASTEYNYELSFKMEEKYPTTWSYSYWSFFTTVGTGSFKTAK